MITVRCETNSYRVATLIRVDDSYFPNSGVNWALDKILK